MRKKETTIIGKLFKLLYILVISFICLIVLVLLYSVITSQIHSKNENYRPKISIYTIVSPSMTPVINVYDVVVNIKVTNPSDIRVGDIITYISTSSASEGMTITHRVVEVKKDEDGNYKYLTQGDNNSNPDSLYVEFDKIIGKEIIIIPKLGKLQFLISNKRSWLYLLLIPIFFFIIKDLYKLIDLLTLKNKVTEITQQDERDKIDYVKQRELKKQLLEAHKDEIEEIDYNKTIKPKEYSNIEVLDTDELTSKIKEYDLKIEQLNKVLDNYQSQVEPPKQIVKEDNYLKGRLRVVSTIDTKNKKDANKEVYKVKKQLETKPKEIKQQITNIESPKSKETTTKKKLILNPKKVPRVIKNKNNRKRNLNLNPNNIKEINRPGRQRTKKIVHNNAVRSERKRLIEIKKIRSSK